MHRPIPAAPGTDQPGQLGVGRRSCARHGSARMDRRWRQRTGNQRGSPRGEAIGGAARQAATLVFPAGEELRRSRAVRRRPTLGRSTRTRATRPAGRPGRGRRPVARRVASDRGFVDRRRNRAVRIAGRHDRSRAKSIGVGALFFFALVVVDGVVGGQRDARTRSRDRGRRRRGPLTVAPCVGRLASRPVLERRADREGAGQAVRLLVGGGARRGQWFRIAAVAVVRARRTRFAIVLERHERTGRRAVHARKPSLGHLADDTRRRAGQPERTATNRTAEPFRIGLNGPIPRSRKPSSSPVDERRSAGRMPNATGLRGALERARRRRVPPRPAPGGTARCTPVCRGRPSMANPARRSRGGAGT